MRSHHQPVLELLLAPGRHKMPKVRRHRDVSVAVADRAACAVLADGSAGMGIAVELLAAGVGAAVAPTVGSAFTPVDLADVADRPGERHVGPDVALS